MEEIKSLIFLSIGCGFASFIVADAHIFSWFRAWIAKKSEFLGDLFSCGLCFGTWLTLFIQIIYQINLINIVPILDLVIGWWIMSLVSTVAWLMLNMLFNLAGK